jgi:competence ComEA-like helix-hairpin-helix protein
MRKQANHNYFYFTKKERRGTVVLLIIITILILIPFFYPLIIKEKVIPVDTYADDIARLALLEDSGKNKKQLFDNDQYHYQRTYTADVTSNTALFYFDPNNTSASDWEKLGVKSKTISTIQNFTSKGGKFREAKDIKRIWGLSPVLADKLIPYVRIGTRSPSTEFTYEKKVYPVNLTTFRKKEYAPVDINASDSGSFTSLPGIGDKLSRRIIKYRDKLGGFYSAEQVGETFGLPDTTFRKIRSSLVQSNVQVKQININTATVDELKAHPYIRYHLANVIIQYREQHGKFNTVDQIRNIMIVTDSMYKKVSPYLTTVQ